MNIAQSNSRAWRAIGQIRVFGRDAGNIAELRDALNARRRARDTACNPRIGEEIERDRRAYGRQERTISEILSTISA